MELAGMQSLHLLSWLLQPVGHHVLRQHHHMAVVLLEERKLGYYVCQRGAGPTLVVGDWPGLDH